MATKYPVILVHGIAIKEIGFFRAFGLIQRTLLKDGHNVTTAKTDGFGSMETNAEQIKKHILKVLSETGAEKVNIIAHSKGGLDSRYLITHFEIADKVASLSCISTPHRGSRIASRLYSLPALIKYTVAAYLHVVYKIMGDEKPEVLKVCRQLSYAEEGVSELKGYEIPDNIFIQSYSVTMERSRDDFIMSIPHLFSRVIEKEPKTDGLVSRESTIFGEFQGDCINCSMSHTEIAGFSLHKKKRKEVYKFYLSLCRDLSERGY